MAESYELPNVDIFDPVMSSKYWAKCATQQEINVYLNKQLDINRKLIIDTIKAQNEINAASSTTVTDHGKRISALETKLAELDQAQTDLNTAFQALTTDNNNFKSNVDLLLNQYQSTINLLQQNVDAIKLSNEQAWAAIAELRSQFDPDKLNAAIQGYQGVLQEAKSYTDAEVVKLNTAIQKVVTDQQAINTDINKLISDNDIKNTEAIATFRNSVNADLEQQNQRITSFIQNTDNVLQTQRTWLTNEIKRVDDRIDSLAKVVSDNFETLTDSLNTSTSNWMDEAVNLRNEYTSFNTSQSMIIESNRVTAENDDKALGERIDSTNDNLDALTVSDGKQWDTINEILTAQNRINAKMEQLNDYIVEQIGLVTARLNPLESGLADVEQSTQAVALRAEYLEQRTGWKYRVSAKAGNVVTTKYSLDFGVLTVATAASQVVFSFALNAGITGLISVKDTGYGMLNLIANGSYNAISNTAQPNVITGYILGYSGSASPIDFMVWYDPNAAEVVFQFGYEKTDNVMPKVGSIPQTVQ